MGTGLVGTEGNWTILLRLLANGKAMGDNTGVIML